MLSLFGPADPLELLKRLALLLADGRSGYPGRTPLRKRYYWITSSAALVGAALDPKKAL